MCIRDSHCWTYHSYRDVRELRSSVPAPPTRSWSWPRKTDIWGKGSPDVVVLGGLWDFHPLLILCPTLLVQFQRWKKIVQWPTQNKKQCNVISLFIVLLSKTVTFFQPFFSHMLWKQLFIFFVVSLKRGFYLLPLHFTYLVLVTQLTQVFFLFLLISNLN